jgi:hypothetical protein
MNKTTIIAGVLVTSVLIGMILLWRDLSHVKSRTKDLIDQHNNMRTLLQAQPQGGQPTGGGPVFPRGAFSDAFDDEEEEEDDDYEDDDVPVPPPRAPLSALKGSGDKPAGSSSSSKKKVQIKEP